MAKALRIPDDSDGDASQVDEATRGVAPENPVACRGGTLPRNAQRQLLDHNRLWPLRSDTLDHDSWDDMIDSFRHVGWAACSSSHTPVESWHGARIGWSECRTAWTLR